MFIRFGNFHLELSLGGFKAPELYLHIPRVVEVLWSRAEAITEWLHGQDTSPTAPVAGQMTINHWAQETPLVCLGPVGFLTLTALIFWAVDLLGLNLRLS